MVRSRGPPGRVSSVMVRETVPDFISLISFHSGREKPTPGRPLLHGEDDAAVLVVPGVVFVLAEDGELDAVDRAEFVEGEAQGHRRQDVNLHEGLPPFVIRPEGAVSLPFRGEVGEFVVVQAGIILRPALLPESLVPAFLPEFGVVGGEAVEHEGS